MNIIYNLAFWFLFHPIAIGLSFAFDQALELPQSSPLPDCQQIQKRDKVVAANIVFKSTDGGQTWQDISKGLPEPVNDHYGVGRNDFFSDDNGLYLTAGNGIYHSKPNSKVPFWIKEIYPDEYSSITPGKTGIFAYNYEGGILQKTNGTSVWSPIFTNFKENRIRTVFETAGGTIFIGSDRGLFKSTNSGKTWKHVHGGGLVMKLVESNGVLVATSMRGIIRSTDDGENWALVISEGGVGIDVERIQGGFAAITFNTRANSRRVRTSYDGGKTWKPIDAGLPGQSFDVLADNPLSQVDLPDSTWNPINTSDSIRNPINTGDSTWNPINTSLPEQAFITSIVQVGKYFFCGHPAGIFRSSDKGKTWKLVLPSVENRVFILSVSGNVIYAIIGVRGC